MEAEVTAIKQWTNKQWLASKKCESEQKTRDGKEASAAEFKRLFKEADVDEDDRLNLAEWMSFVQKSEAAKGARGEPSTPKTEEYNTSLFNTLNKITESEDGISKEDIAAGFNYARRCVQK